jgi:hypothetical protein
MSRVKSQGRVSRPTAPPRDKLRGAIESFDTIDVVADEMREISVRDYPDLAAKLPPRKPPAPCVVSRRRPRRG